MAKVESEYLDLNDLDKSPQFVSTKNIIFFRSGSDVEIYLANVAPYFMDAVLVSADGLYPKDPVVKKKAMDSLSDDPSTVVVVFNTDAFSRMKVATQRILALDNIMINYYRRSSPYHNSRMDLSSVQIAKLISNFVEQWEHISSATNLRIMYSSGKSFSPPREQDWRFEMMGLSPRRLLRSNSGVFMYETIFYRSQQFYRNSTDFSEQAVFTEVKTEFHKDFDIDKDRFFSFISDKVTVGAVCIKIQSGNLLLRCLHFEPAFNSLSNYESAITKILQAFPRTEAIHSVAEESQRSLLLSLGFTEVRALNEKTLMFAKAVKPDLEI